MIGANGQQIKKLGRVAREKIERFLGQSVYLDLWVKVLPNWRRNRAAVMRLGYGDPNTRVSCANEQAGKPVASSGLYDGGGVAFGVRAGPGGGTESEGALFLSMPPARAIGQGDAAVADTSLGTEAMWWNPALLARLPKREIAVHNVQSIAFDANTIALAMPSKMLRDAGGLRTIVDFGSLPYTDPNPGASSGGSFGHTTTSLRHRMPARWGSGSMPG